MSAIAFVPTCVSIAIAIWLWRTPVNRSVVVEPQGGTDGGSTTGIDVRKAWRSVVAKRLAVAGLVAALLTGQVVLVVVGLLGAQVTRVSRKRRQTSASERMVTAELAEVIDLFAVALASGHNLASATAQVAEWAPDKMAEALKRCIGQAQMGVPLADALETLPARLGDQVRPLVSALVAHDRVGAPVGPALSRLAGDVRTDRRRQAETTARRLPVVMVFPLVVCVLPAFVLLTIVPVVADTLSGLDWLGN